MTDKIENENKDEVKELPSGEAPEGAEVEQDEDLITEDELEALLNEVETLRKTNAELKESRARQRERLKNLLIGGDSASGKPSEKSTGADTSQHVDTSDHEVDQSYLTLEKFF